MIESGEQLLPSSACLFDDRIFPHCRHRSISSCGVQITGGSYPDAGFQINTRLHSITAVDSKALGKTVVAETTMRRRGALPWRSDRNAASVAVEVAWSRDLVLGQVLCDKPRRLRESQETAIAGRKWHETSRLSKSRSEPVSLIGRAAANQGLAVPLRVGIDTPDLIRSGLRTA